MKLEDIYEILDAMGYKTPNFFRLFKNYSPNQYIKAMYIISRIIKCVETHTFMLAKIILEDRSRFEVYTRYANNGQRVSFYILDKKNNILIGCKDNTVFYEPDIRVSNEIKYTQTLLTHKDACFLEEVYNVTRDPEIKKKIQDITEQNTIADTEVINIYEIEASL